MIERAGTVFLTAVVNRRSVDDYYWLTLISPDGTPLTDFELTDEELDSPEIQSLLEDIEADIDKIRRAWENWVSGSNLRKYQSQKFGPESPVQIPGHEISVSNSGSESERPNSGSEFPVSEGSVADEPVTKEYAEKNAGADFKDIIINIVNNIEDTHDIARRIQAEIRRRGWIGY